MVCDLAETYGVLDWRALPATRLAALCAGLREDSRVMMRLRGENADLKAQLLAACLDALNVLAWQHSRYGRTGENFPPSVLARLMRTEAHKDESQGFESPAEYEAAWEALTGVRHTHGGKQ